MLVQDERVRMKRFRSSEGGIELAVQLELLSDSVSKGLLEGLIASFRSIETDSSSFIRNEARPIGGILARLFFEKLSRVNMKYLR